MQNRKLTTGVVVAIVIAVTAALVVAFQSNQNIAVDTEPETQANSDLDDLSTNDNSTMEPNVPEGDFIQYSMSNLTENTNVIFFSASWCPTCQALKRDINSNISDIPNGVTILEADFDSETALRQKYGVTVQHTLVQVDKDGNQIKKWNGGNGIDSILNNIQET